MSRLYAAVFLLALISITSCKEEDCTDNGTCPQQSVTEKVDYNISGEFNYSDDLESLESDKSLDLVTYKTYDEEVGIITFNLNLANGHMLKLHIFSATSLTPWEQVDVPYNIYPTQDLEDKTEFLIAEYYVGTEIPAYVSNLGVNYPPGAILEAFKITYFDGLEIHCRMQELQLFKILDLTKTIEINGTFVGAVTFL